MRLLPVIGLVLLAATAEAAPPMKVDALPGTVLGEGSPRPEVHDTADGTVLVVRFGAVTAGAVEWIASSRGGAADGSRSNGRRRTTVELRVPVACIVGA